VSQNNFLDFAYGVFALRRGLKMSSVSGGATDKGASN